MELTKNYQLISSVNIYYDGGVIGQLRTYGKYVSQDQVNNSTLYKIKQALYYNGYDNPRVFTNTTSTLDGTSVVHNKITINKGYELTIQELSRTKTHNADGTSGSKTISARFRASGGFDVSTSGSVTFPSISRYAYITGTLTSATDESTFYFDYNNPLGLQMACWLEVNPIGTHLCERNNIGSATTGTYTWELTASEIESLQSALTNSSTGTIRIGLYSTNGGVQQASYKDIPFSISNANPTFNVAYQDINSTTTAITSDNQKLIQNNSTLQLNITNATALKGASLSTISVTINNQTDSTSISTSSLNINVGTLDLNEDTPANITLTDSRGNKATQTITLSMLAWEQPSAIVTINRKQNFYTETNINVDASYSSLNNQNTITIDYRTKKQSELVWGSWVSISDNVPATFNADNQYAWNIQVRVQDRLDSKLYESTLGVGIPKFFIDRHLKSIGINCFPTRSNTIELSGIDLSNTYTTNEMAIGTWINGETIYRKVIDTGAISSMAKSVPHYITGLSNVISIKGMALASNGNYYTLPRTSISALTSQIELYVTNFTIEINAGSTANFDSSFVILEYIK